MKNSKVAKAVKSQLQTVSAFKPDTTFKGGSLRSQWIANQIHCKLATLTKGGLFMAAKTKPSKANLELCWFLLKVPHHVRLENYSRATGITSKGVKAISSGKIDYQEVQEMLKNVSAKVKPKGYTEISITTRS